MINLNDLCKKQQAILVYSISSRSADLNENIKEFLSLAFSAKIQVLDTVINKSKVIHAKYFIGIGKLLELQHIIQHKSISIILFSCTLSPNQEYNLIHFLKCKIVDRNQLILNIFAQRARTYEGKLQVKLAQLRYLNSRLTHEWGHLERQQGGIGIRGGPGEMQLESDRRLLNKNILRVLSDLKKIENQREQNRYYRMKMGVPVVSLIGYTNAGKSTLFNVMTASNVETSKKLFVTLDPICRRIINQKKCNMMLVDTVGFIQNLPQDLIDSFKSTLKETVYSTLLLHIIDVSNNKFDRNIDVVNCILDDIHIRNIPILLVMNKIDQVSKIRPHIDRNIDGVPTKVWISARKNLGISLLKEAINELLPNYMIRYDLRMPINSDLCQRLYQLQAVEKYYQEDKNTITLKIQLSTKDWNRLIKYHKSLLSYII